MFDAFMKIEGIKGESTSKEHKEWFELLAFSTGLEQAASLSKSSAGGGTAARADFHDFTITKALDVGTPKIAFTCAVGDHISEITIDLCRAAGKEKVTYMQYILTDVIISSVSTGASGDAFPSEDLSFNFGKIEWKYIKQNRAGGSGAGTVAETYDLTQD